MTRRKSFKKFEYAQGKSSDRDISDYLDYREFIAERVASLKSSENLKVQEICLRFGFKSSSYLKMILSRERSLGPKSADRVARGLGLNAESRDYFLKLVQLNDEPDKHRQSEILKDILESRRIRNSKSLAPEIYRYFSYWFMIPILEIISSRRPATEKRICKSLKLSQKDLDLALQTLFRLGLIEKAGDRWKRTSVNFETPQQMGDLSLFNFYRQMQEMALGSLSSLPPEKRVVMGLCIALSEKDFSELREDMFRVLQKWNSKYEGSTQLPDGVYQILIQGFELFDFDGEGRARS